MFSSFFFFLLLSIFNAMCILLPPSRLHVEDRVGEGLGGFAYLLPYSQPGLDVNKVCLSVFVCAHSSISSGCSETQYCYSTVISLKQNQPTRNSPNPFDNNLSLLITVLHPAPTGNTVRKKRLISWCL